VSDRALTPEDVARGRALFEGAERFASGAPPCLGCHTVERAGGLGGGRLGPDLTSVYARLEGRKALVAWLSAPPGPTMQPVYAKTPLEGEEVLALVAYLKDAGETAGTAPATAPSLVLLAIAVGGLAGSLLLLDVLWRGRFRGVRRSLVEGSRR
jgi:mono/diheme cytochrome c family protein